MPYSAQAALSQDRDFFDRVSACAAVEAKPNDPRQWTVEHIWWVAAAPGFAEAYEYALNTNVVRPGNDPGVITDGQILASVQATLPPVVPEEIPE